MSAMEEQPQKSSSHLFDVYLRLRPATASTVGEAPFLKYTPGEPHIHCIPQASFPQRKRSKGIEKFSFTHIFDESSTQRDVFTEVTVPLLAETVKGRDGMLATLGVTGSGKTHTILGNTHQRGITQLTLDTLFRSIGERMVNYDNIDLSATDATEALVMDAPSFHDRMSTVMDTHIKRASLNSIPKTPDVSDITVPIDPNARYAVLISMYELYNDRLYDLLDETTFTQPTARRKALIFKKCESGGNAKKVVTGLRKIYVRSLPEALMILEHGQACRHASPTGSNLRSSRSHAFFAIEVKRISRLGWTHARSATLHIVDLAGSERSKHANTVGERLAEAGSINRSLMCLGQCLQLQSVAASEAGNSAAAAVPYRQSKLTELLFTNSFLSGKSQRATMIVTADPKGEPNATMQILRYSALARDVTLPRGVTRKLSNTSDVSASDIASVAGSVNNGANGHAELISRLIAQLDHSEREKRELEERLLDAEDRLLCMEQEIREEIAEEMDAALRDQETAFNQRLAEEREKMLEQTDKKIELIGTAAEAQAQGPGNSVDEEEFLELQEQNEELHMLVRRLMKENARLRGDGSPKRRAPGAAKGVSSVLGELENLNLNRNN